jgi:large subunit ribosomal protein L23
MTDLRHYDVIVSPVITEKSTLVSERTRLSSTSRRRATKPEIKAAVEALFGQGHGCQHAGPQGQDQALPRHAGRQSDVKKAIVTLAEGQSIDVSTGL